MSASNLHIAWARLFVRAAAVSGVRDVVLSPGSRSTPLALAAAESGEVRVHPIVDERSAAFFALGQARVTGRPSLLLCTSGTAGAHYYPALIEASRSCLPLVVVTADRPWELYEAAAPQTIDQVKLFGGYVRRFAEIGLPDPSPTALRAVARIAAQCVLAALAPEPGPTHINARFRKPLEPIPAAGPEPWEPEWEALMRRGATRTSPSRSTPDEAAVAELVERCARAERGLLVCGPSLGVIGSPRGEGPRIGRSDPTLAGDTARAAAGRIEAPLMTAGTEATAYRAAVARLSRATGFPLLAEATSQARFGAAERGITTVSAFDLLMRGPAFRARYAPDLLIEIGAPPTSQGYAEFIADHRECPRVVLAPHGWNDPNSGAAALVFGDPRDVCEAVAERMPAARRTAGRPWAEALAAADARAWAVVGRELIGEELSEGSVARLVSDGCPEGSILVVGNSSPVRDLDMYCPSSGKPIHVLHQRGASGIDGLVSGAAGVASVVSVPVTLLLGDLSLLHDLTGLCLARSAAGPLVLVVVQNSGGRIFERLPIGRAAACSDVFERCFTTPQRVEFAHAAAMFDLAYAKVATKAGLAAALATAWDRSGATLIEAVVPPSDGARRAERVQSAVDAVEKAGSAAPGRAFGASIGAGAGVVTGAESVDERKP